MAKRIGFLLILCSILLISVGCYADQIHTLRYVSQTADTLYLNLEVYTTPQPLPGVSISTYYFWPWRGVAVDGASPGWPATPGFYSQAYTFGSTEYLPITWPITVGEGVHVFQAYIRVQQQGQYYQVGEPLHLYIGNNAHELLDWDMSLLSANEYGLYIRISVYNPTTFTWYMYWPVQPIACFSINNRMIIAQTFYDGIYVNVPPGETWYTPIPYIHDLNDGIYRVQAYLMLPDGRIVPVGDEETVNLGNVQNLEFGIGDIADNQPVDFNWVNSLFECVYRSDQLSGIHGDITSLAFYNCFSGEGIEDVPVKIYLGNTVQTDLSGDWIGADELSLVFDGLLNFPSEENEILFNLDTPFTLNQGQNLVMMVQHQGSDWIQSSKQFRCQYTGASSGRMATGNEVPPDPENPPDSAALINVIPRLGIWYIPGVDVDDDLAPEVQSLSTYPNPFKAQSTLDFNLKDAGPVQIGIYNLKGQLLRTLHDGFMATGAHTLIWDGCDERGSGVANGIYLYRIDSPQGQSISKVLRLK